MYKDGAINKPTKEAFYEWIEKEGGLEGYHEMMIQMIINFDYNLIGKLEYNYDTGIVLLKSYTIKNPANEEKDNYIATQNGDYTFIVEDTITGKQYNKTVNVSNIGENDKYYIGNIEYDTIGLLDKNNNEPTTFDSAFIIYNNELIEITELIYTNSKYSLISGWSLSEKFGNKLEFNTQQTFLFGKNGAFYVGEAIVAWAQ